MNKVADEILKAGQNVGGDPEESGAIHELNIVIPVDVSADLSDDEIKNGCIEFMYTLLENEDMYDVMILESREGKFI